MKFYKFQALGNDFLITNESELRTINGEYEKLASEICDRHFGAGADGLEIILDGRNAGNADFEIRLFNADGGETPISGNGTRCVAAYLYLINGWDRDVVRIATGAGIKELRPIERRPGSIIFETDMGRPGFASHEIPVLLSEPKDRVVGEYLELDGKRIEFTSVSMGNPHCSIFVDNFTEIEWRSLGSRIEKHPAFPERTNLEFIKIVDRENIEVRFWERGCGETLASGTGSCAAALAAMLNEFTENRVNVITEAGSLVVEWLEGGAVMQTGEASFVYKGEWPLGSENGR